MDTHPGVYVEEISHGPRPIAGVPTSNAAFVDWFPRGPMNVATPVTSWVDFERVFGGLHASSAASWHILQFFLNGGTRAWIVRIGFGDLTAAALNLESQGNEIALALSAASPGSWGRRLYAAVVHDAASDGTSYDLILREYDGSRLVAVEDYSSLSIDQGNPRFAPAIINRGSRFVTATQVNGVHPKAQITRAGVGTLAQADMTQFTGGGDGALPGSAAWDAGAQAAFTDVNDTTPGLEALNRIEPEVFNILCLPAVAELPQASAAAVYADAYRLCRDRRAVLLVDIAEAGNRHDLVIGWLAARGLTDLENAAAFFPRVKVPNPLTGDTIRISASGTVAGIMARVDGTRDVWKASAGAEAGLRGATPTSPLTDLQNDELNVQGVNAIRSFPVYGPAVWGARTLAGADAAASEWKYLPVRRLALFLEQSIYQGLAWVVFEPNDEPLWGQIRLNVEAFMQGLFLRGAFQGTSPRQAYYVVCDRSNNPQSDVDPGIVNIDIGFAPLRPAEFVVLKFRQIAGQPQS